MNWKYGDLRILDGIDTINPDQDLIAVYARINDQTFQIRLDFLELDTFLGKDIYIAIDTNPGGVTQALPYSIDLQWEYLIKISDSGDIGIFDKNLSPFPGVELFIVYDSWQDRIIISFDKDLLPIYYGKTKMQVSITAAGQTAVTDISEQFSLDSPSPSKVNVLFAFWNTFSSVTPAETLRSWAGAHTGPISSRHGLRYLLDSASKYKSTVFLLDLLSPDTLSALDYLNALPRIRNLVNDGILVLPENSLFEILDKNNSRTNILALEYTNLSMDLYETWKISINLESKLSISNDKFILLLNNYVIKDISNYIFGGYGYAQSTIINNKCILTPFAINSPREIQYFEFTLECKRLLVHQAITKSPAPLIWGGDFSKSVMGDPVMSSEVFSYIHEHPWINTYSINDLKGSTRYASSRSFPYLKNTLDNNTDRILPPVYDDTSNKVHESLLQSPQNQISDLAWKVFFDLTQAASPELLSLRTNYIGQIGMLLTAANWADKPQPIEACDLDLDYDGFNECILANNSIFTVIEPDGGYIAFVFASDINGIHQLVGPTWEFIVGLSDATSWEINLGVRGDPRQILGAFQDPFSHWNRYHVNIIDHGIVLETDNMTIRKTISISADRIHIVIHLPVQSIEKARIPLVVDPWLRYTSGWGNLYSKQSAGNNFFWRIRSGETVEIRSTNLLNEYSFNDTYPAMSRPEDPNFDYSAGHYIPFPMSVVEINNSEIYSTDILINP